jgi:hypothetical protein
VPGGKFAVCDHAGSFAVTPSPAVTASKHNFHNFVALPIACMFIEIPV